MWTDVKYFGNRLTSQCLSFFFPFCNIWTNSVYHEVNTAFGIFTQCSKILNWLHVHLCKSTAFVTSHLFAEYSSIVSIFCSSKVAIKFIFAYLGLSLPVVWGVIQVFGLLFYQPSSGPSRWSLFNSCQSWMSLGND